MRRDILDHFTAQDQTEIGFREQNYSCRRKNLSLVRCDPKQLRRGESGHGLVAGRRAQGGPAFFQDTTLGSRPPIIPENAGPQGSQCRIEQRCAVHLARQADALDISHRMIGLQGVKYRKGRIDPVCRLLLGMAGTRRSRRQRLARACDHALSIIDENGLDRRGAEIDAEIHDACKLWTSITTPRRRIVNQAKKSDLVKGDAAYCTSRIRSASVIELHVRLWPG